VETLDFEPGVKKRMKQLLCVCVVCYMKKKTNIIL